MAGQVVAGGVGRALGGGRLPDIQPALGAVGGVGVVAVGVEGVAAGQAVAGLGAGWLIVPIGPGNLRVCERVTDAAARAGFAGREGRSGGGGLRGSWRWC